MTASGSGCCRGAGSNFNQYTASITVNILTFSHGATLGWLSPFLPLLESAESPMNTGPITVEQASWIGSLLCVGEVFGMVLFYVLTRVLGKKAALQLSVITHFGFWMLVYFGEEVYLLYIARFMTGVTGGALLLCVPLFVADIAELSIRGLLSSMLAGASTLGIFVGYCTGAFFSYTTVPLIMLIAPVIYSLILCMFPDTPYSLLKRNRPEKAMKSLQFYRNLSDADVLGNENFQNEFNNLKNSYAKEVENSSKRAFNLGDFTNKEGRKGLTLGILLMILNQVSGGFTILNYSATIFASAGATNWSPNDSAMFIGFIQLVGCIISTGLVDKVGRKILLLVSLISVAIGLAALGVYSYLQEINIDVTNYTWVPVATLSFVFFMTAIGIYGLPFVLLAEVLPLNIRNIGSTICVIVVAVAAFISLKIFPILLKDIQLHGCMWGYAALTVIGTVTLAFCLPETKGKDLFAAGQKPK